MKNVYLPSSNKANLIFALWFQYIFAAWCTNHRPSVHHQEGNGAGDRAAILWLFHHHGKVVRFMVVPWNIHLPHWPLLQEVLWRQ
jgi:hypothetical protein